MNRLPIILLLLLLLLPACSLLEGDGTESEGTREATTVTPGPTPTAGVTPEPTEAAAPQEQIPIKIWVVEELSPAANAPGGSILAGQLAAYELNHPDVQLDLEVKTATGRGGIVSYLRSGPDVAPSVLPDLVALPADLLPVVVGEGLVNPLEAYIDEADQTDLFPAARSLGHVNGQLFGYPMTLDNLTHMAYSTEVFTQTVPVTWDELIAPDQATFAFPGAGLPGAELLLQLYLAEGGFLTNEANQPTLQVEPLTAALQRFSDGRANGAIPVETSGLTNYVESWQTFGAIADSVQTADSQYLALRAEGSDSAFAGIPGTARPVAPLVDGWTWAISAADPTRQAVAADVMNWLIAGPNMGDWSLAASRLPARRTSFEQWPAGDEYTQFLQQELELAEPYPTIAKGTLLDALGTALFDVLSLASSPEVAAQAAVDELGQ